MSDDSSKRGQPDRNRINKDQAHEIRYWSQKFNVSQDELRRAIDAVGPMASAVEQHLQRHQRIGAGTANTMRRPTIDVQQAAGKDSVQGEGNYEAARAFDEAEQKFVASGKVPAAARAAAPKSEAEQEGMVAAEEEGKRRAKK